MTELRRPEVAPSLGEGKQRARVTLSRCEVSGLELHLLEGIERNRLELGRPILLGDRKRALAVVEAPVETKAIRPGERESRVTAHQPGRIPEHLSQVERLIEQRGGGPVVHRPGEDRAELLERRQLQCPIAALARRRQRPLRVVPAGVHVADAPVERRPAKDQPTDVGVGIELDDQPDGSVHMAERFDRPRDGLGFICGGHVIRDRVRGLPRPLPVIRERRVGVLLRRGLEPTRPSADGAVDVAAGAALSTRPLARARARMSTRFAPTSISPWSPSSSSAGSRSSSGTNARATSRSTVLPATESADAASLTTGGSRSSRARMRRSSVGGTTVVLSRAERTNSRRYSGTPSDALRTASSLSAGRDPPESSCRSRRSSSSVSGPSSSTIWSGSARRPSTSAFDSCPCTRRSGGDHKDAVSPRDLAQAAKGVERARVAPVQILQAQHDRPGAGRLGPERRDGRQRAEARGLRRSIRIVGARLAADETLQDRSGLALHHDRWTRPIERGRGGRRTACSRRARCSVPDPPHVRAPRVPASLGEQAALPDPCFTDHEDRSAGSRCKVVDRIGDRAQLVHTTHERNIRVGSPLCTCECDCRLDGLALALELEPPRRAPRHPVAELTPRFGPDEHRSDVGLGLQPGGDVHGVAGGARLLVAPTPDGWVRRWGTLQMMCAGNTFGHR